MTPETAPGNTWPIASLPSPDFSKGSATLRRLIYCAALGFVVVSTFLASDATASSGSTGETAAVKASCGDLSGRMLYSIRTQRVTCAAARQIAAQWASQCASLRTGSCLVTALFYCRYRNTGYESGAIRCVHDSDLRKPLVLQRTVAFVTGS
jgi:hypothetical protein